MMQSFFMQTKKIKTDSADAQADFSLYWAHMSEDTFSPVADQYRDQTWFFMH